jgi:hypothetical protein
LNELQRRRLLRRTSTHNPVLILIGEHREGWYGMVWYDDPKVWYDLLSEGMVWYDTRVTRPWATVYAVELNSDAQDQLVCRCRR